MNNRLLVPRKTPGLLDLVPGAAAAYSLRSLSNSYADPVVTVRRSSDDAEEDFTAAEVADGTLAAFAGAGDGFVKQWWDQSGSANHAVAAADTNEPKIVDAGVVITEGGKPALQFDGSNDYMETSSAVSFANVGAFVVFKHKDAGNNWKRIINTWSSGAADGWFIGRYFNTNQIEFRIEPQVADGVITIPDSSLTDGEQLIVSAVYAQGSGNIYRNGALEDSQGGLTPSFAATQKIGIGARLFSGSVLEAYALTVNEVVIYSTDVSSQRELIEGNIAWSYS
jgi:hypothetical protein